MDTGTLGETLLEHWASQVDLIANKAKVDKDGWDFYIGFPKIYDANLKALDLDDRHTECLIQVKTTTTDKKSWPIKISNLKRLVESPLPAFYLVIKVSKNGEAKRAFLYHVWEKITERVLKKLRELSKNNDAKLNEVRMQLPISIAQPFSELHGTELLKLLKKNIGESKSKYVDEKSSIRKNTGYTQERGKMEFKMTVPENYKGKPDELLIDFSLGLIDNLKLEEHTFFDSRFGHDIEIRSGKGGKLSLTNLKKDGKAIIELWTSDHRLNTQISTDFFVPKGVEKSLIKEKFKILYKADHLDIVSIMHNNRLDFNIKTPPIDQKSLLSSFREMADFAFFISRVQEAYETICFRIKHDNERTVTGEFVFESDVLTGDITNQIRSIYFAIRIVEYFKIKNEIHVELKELFQQHTNLKFLSDLISPNLTKVENEFYVEKSIDQYDEAIAIFPLLVKIGQYLIAIQGSIHGQPDRTGNLKDGNIKYTISNSYSSIEDYRCISNENIDVKAVFKEMQDNTVSKYESEKNTVIIFNPESTENN